MNIKMNSKIFSLLIIAMSLFISGSAFASCVFSGYGYGTGGVNIFPNGYSFVIPKGMPVGYEIFSGVDTSLGFLSKQYTCTNGGQLHYNLFSLQKSSLPHVYNTGIPGVGISFMEEGTNRYYENPSNSVSLSGGRTKNIIYKLIKTGDITAGKMLAVSPVISLTDDTGQSIWWIGLYGGATVTQAYCSINSSNITVPLADVMPSELQTVGGTAKPKVFNLSLTCDAGTPVNIKFAGTKNTDTSADGVLQLTNAGSSGVAKGVGLQVLYGNSPVTLNSGDYLNLKTAAGGQESLPFTVQYYRTNTAVTVGSVNATATIDVEYQ